MNNNELEKFILNFSGVSQFDLPHLRLKRYLIHDIPFAVVTESKDGDNCLNIKLNRGKQKELKARFSDVVCESDFYDSYAWLTIRLDKENVPNSVIFDALCHAYYKIIGEFSALSRVIYSEETPVQYNLNEEALLKAFSKLSPLDFSKKIDFLD